MSEDSKILWSPDLSSQSQMSAFRHWVNEEHQTQLQNYEDLYQWSITEISDFWGAIAKFCGIKWMKEPTQPSLVTDRKEMLNPKWFPGARLNYAHNLLSSSQNSSLYLFREGYEAPKTRSYQNLLEQVYSLQKVLGEVGIHESDRIAAVTGNTYEALCAMLATTSLGASWSSSSPDFGTQAIIDRMGQLSPRVLFYTPSYKYGGKVFDCLSKLPTILKAIPSIELVVLLDEGEKSPSKVELSVPILWTSELEIKKSTTLADIRFTELPFDHPLFILFSSGTTGIPKCIVHSVGGTLIQHKKELMLHSDIGPDSNLLYFTTCGWMMWNWMVSSLSTGSSLTLYDGSVTAPSPDILWRVVENTRTTHFGTSPKFLSYSQQSHFEPANAFNLSHLKCILSTGSPLLPEQFEWVYSHVKENLHLASISGGTDIVSCFMLGNPDLSVRAGEIQCLGLGMAVEAWDENGLPVKDEKGELVCTAPFPSMPIGFFGDPDGKKYKSAYFEDYLPRLVWRHGDFIRIRSHGGIEMFGRSDATLNPGGVRIGTSEIYRTVENLDFVSDSIAVGIPVKDDIEIWLFVILEKEECGDWQSTIKSRIKAELSPRHVPRQIFSIKDIPYTRSGKKVELAVKKVILGEQVQNSGAFRNPESLEEFRKFALNEV